MIKESVLWMIILVLVFCLSVSAQASEENMQGLMKTPIGINNWENDSLREDWAYTIGIQAYIWGYPLVDHYNRYLYMSKNTQLAVGTVNGSDAGPVATIDHICFLSNFTTPKERYIGCPNHDSLYGYTFFDLEKEPAVLRIPDMGNRYWIAEMCHSTTEVFASPGTRRGSKAGNYLIVGPDWEGTVPDDIVEVLHAPDNIVNVLFRVQVRGESDLDTVRPLINNITSGSLSDIDTIPKTIDYNNLPRVEVPNEKDWAPDDTFWEVFRAAMKNTGYRENESALLEMFRQTGLNTSDDEALNRGLSRALTDGRRMVWDKTRFRNLGPDTLEYGWNMVLSGGAFGTDFLTRAAQAPKNTYIHLPEDCLYYYQEFDSHGETLNGKNRYRIHFDKDNLPPYNQKAFWSLTVYDTTEFFFSNPYGRYNVGSDTEPDITFNEDGSLDLYLQTDKPEGKESNWIPVPEYQQFYLYLRVYMPDQSALNGKYNPPAVVRTV